MKKVALLFAALYCLQCTAMGQNGRIVFERKVNAWALMRAMADQQAFPQERFEAYKNGNPEYKTARFILQFNEACSYFYADSAAPEVSIDEWFAMVGAKLVYTDLAHHWQMLQARVFDSSFAVADKPWGFLWETSGAQRMIAGYHCRRATTLLQDSIPVVAWYTTALPLPVGPGIFQGLPGAILAIELPTLLTTWQATAVLHGPQHIDVPLAKAPVSYATLREVVYRMTRSWATAGALVLQRALL
ncbi:hypothetical protein DCC81_04150 [Chitinophaga parva]|uniref:GLPGLI family protein n=1 Tax=Chitinophaga parva TaxID=2169414 RepID=A0A2T7BLX8_9BACT|nr:GLPGLI family protein [Chitinophaga parva]PUZ28684.1 hypothetical protein DCC81_04150 [Chitinophaga parva]